MKVSPAAQDIRSDASQILRRVNAISIYLIIDSNAVQQVTLRIRRVGCGHMAFPFNIFFFLHPSSVVGVCLFSFTCKFVICLVFN